MWEPEEEVEGHRVQVVCGQVQNPEESPDQHPGQHEPVEDGLVAGWLVLLLQQGHNLEEDVR